MKIIELTHPEYEASETDWQKYRYIMDGGEEFIEAYLDQFSSRETADDFTARKSVSPLPGFARGAIIDVKNSIFQRMNNITRAGGPKQYQRAIAGENGGIDRSDSTINSFIGSEVLPELLFMGRVGVFLDMPPLEAEHTKADEQGKNPYAYVYPTEQILNWKRDAENNLVAVLLKEYYNEVDPEYGLPTEQAERYLLYREIGGSVSLDMYDADGGLENSFILPAKRIPLVIFEMEQPLTKDIANHQIALLNLESADVSYALKANFPFYTEQEDGRQHSKHLKGPNDLADPGGTETSVGSVQGRKYGKDLERPGFIHPSSEPIKASIEKQKQLKDDIRMLVNLALSNVNSKFSSAESKQMDSRGLESGLSAIGMILEHGERQLATLYSAYIGTKDVATIHYPERYSLKTDDQRIAEATALAKQMPVVPSKTFHRAIAKEITDILLNTKISPDDFESILKEIDAAKYMTGDADAIHGDIERGLVSLETAAVARGYDKNEVTQAAKDHAERLARVAEAQGQEENSGARGTDDDPQGAKDEKTASQNPDIQEHGGKAVRGKGEKNVSAE